MNEKEVASNSNEIINTNGDCKILNFFITLRQKYQLVLANFVLLQSGMF